MCLNDRKILAVKNKALESTISSLVIEPIIKLLAVKTIIKAIFIFAIVIDNEVIKTIASFIAC